MTNTTFASLKKNAKGSLASLTSKLEAQTKKGGGGEQSFDDNRFWTLTAYKTGNGKAVIRFLPAPQGEDDPWARVFSHAFQGETGQWYIENSLASVGKEDPVQEYNKQLWNTGLEVNKNRARAQKRRLSYYSNVLVVSDPAKPENEGKVFLFKYGKSIFDMLQGEAMPPEVAEEDRDEDYVPKEGYDPFCLWTGANLTLRAHIDTKTKMRSYDKSKFAKPTPIAANDKEIEAIWLQAHPLLPFLDPENTKFYKTYDQLKTRLNMVIGAGAGLPTKSAAAPSRTLEAADEASEESPFVESEEDAEALKLFEKLAKAS